MNDWLEKLMTMGKVGRQNPTGWIINNWNDAGVERPTLNEKACQGRRRPRIALAQAQFKRKEEEESFYRARNMCVCVCVQPERPLSRAQHSFIFSSSFWVIYL